MHQICALVLQFQLVVHLKTLAGLPGIDNQSKLILYVGLIKIKHYLILPIQK